MMCFAKIIRFALLASAGAVASAAMISDAAAEAAAPHSSVACLQTPAKMSDSEVQAFLSNPQGLLSSNPGGGLPLTEAVRRLAGSDSNAFQKIMDLVKVANESQKSAIAGGLARVVSLCGDIGSAPAQDYAAQIQASVANSGDQYLTSTFQQSSQEVNAASVGPGAAGNAVGGGATTPNDSQQGAANEFRYAAETPINTTSGQYTIGTVNSVGDSEDVISPTQ
jgi:hypothetical protein